MGYARNSCVYTGVVNRVEKPMKLIPFERFTIISDKNESELISCRQHRTKKIRLKQSNKKPYKEKIENNSFKINRIIYCQNPFYL